MRRLVQQFGSEESAGGDARNEIRWSRERARERFNGRLHKGGVTLK